MGLVFNQEWLKNSVHEILSSGFFLSKEKNEVSDILLSIKKSKMDYLDFNIEKRSLESIFVDFIKKEKND